MARYEDRRRHRRSHTVGAYLLVAVLCGLTLTGLVAPTVGLTALTTSRAIGLYDFLPADLDVTTESQQSRILYHDGTLMARFYYQNRIDVPLRDIAPMMGRAVVAIEDQRFYQHSGADLRGIARAVVNNLGGHDRQGASTLTQQWVRNLLLDQARDRGDEAQVRAQLSGDGARKIAEIRLAVAAEHRFTKDQILNAYLNIALFGENQYGVETASQRYFAKPAKDLSLVDAALLAGVIQQPTRFDPLRHPAAAMRRRNVVLAAMRDHGNISARRYRTAVRTPIATQLHPRPMPNGCLQAGPAAAFCDYVTHVIARDPVFGDDVATRQRLLYRGGLTIRTTLDRSMQTQAQRTLQRRAAADSTPGVGATITTVQAGTGRILTMAQNRPYSPAPSPRHTTTALNYNVDASMGGGMGFQTGSAYKPFTLATWLASGHTLTERVDATRTRYDTATAFNTQGCGPPPAGSWYPDNAEGGGAGSMSVLDATAESVNTAYATMATRVSLCRIRQTAQSLGVHPATGGDLSASPASVLGTNEVAPLSMAAAFAGFADDGRFCEPVAIRSVTTPAGQPLKVPAADCHQAIPSQVASGVNAALTQVITRGTMRGVGGIGRPAAGKTGTTDDSTETWFVGYTPRRLATAVWVGTPDSRPSSVNGATIGGRRYGEVFGATIAGAMWRDYMTQAVAGTPVTRFTPYSPWRDRVGTRTVPDVRGMSPEDASATLDASGLRARQAGTTASPVTVGDVAAVRPGPGTRLADGDTVTLLLSSGPAPSPVPSDGPTPEPGPSTTSATTPAPTPDPSPSTTPVPAARATDSPASSGTPSAPATRTPPVTPSRPPGRGSQ